MRTLWLVMVAAMSFLQLASFSHQPGEFKRRQLASDEDLRKQLQAVPEFGMNQTAAADLYERIRKNNQAEDKVPIQPNIGIVYWQQLAQVFNIPEAMHLPWRSDQDSQMGRESAERLHVLSINLRRMMRESVPENDIRIDAIKLSKSLAEDKLEWKIHLAIPTLIQMLQPENAATRNLLVDMLAKMDGKEASVALAQRAIFDLSPHVREKAISSLAKRNTKDFMDVLVLGLRWPWDPVADHAAEAIVALRMKDAIPDLVRLLKEPDPGKAFVAESGGQKQVVIREVVRVNHMTNCCLCHAYSESKQDLVRGRIPLPGDELPPEYYQAQDGQFVRADTTFLRQDFSVFQPVDNPGKWPAFQRYDYILRIRTATGPERNAITQKKNDTFPQREAIFFALRELTGTDRGITVDAWLPLLNPIENKSK